MSPLDLSVVVPAHDAASTLAATVHSVVGAEGLLELIVVDDGSVDDTAAVALRLAGELAAGGRPELRVVSQPRRGPSEARNAGAASARGGVLAFLDADDLWLVPPPDPRRVGLRSGAGIAVGRVQCVAGEPPRPVGSDFEGWLTGAALIRRDVFAAVGPFEPGMDRGEDLDWFLRAREQGVRIASCDEVVLGYRLHGGTLTSRRADRSHGLLTALQRSVVRRRGDRETGDREAPA